MSLLQDDDCRVCFHGPHPDSICVEIDFMGTDEDGNELYSPCYCDEYVDLEAESKIVVRITGDEQGAV